MPLEIEVSLGFEGEVEEGPYTTYVLVLSIRLQVIQLLIFVRTYGWQDLGNTNFSIHLPRLTFDRHHTAQIVLRAVRSLGIDANVNDRNDICIGKEKIGSF